MLRGFRGDRPCWEPLGSRAGSLLLGGARPRVLWEKGEPRGCLRDGKAGRETSRGILSDGGTGMGTGTLPGLDHARPALGTGVGPALGGCSRHPRGWAGERRPTLGHDRGVGSGPGGGCLSVRLRTSTSPGRGRRRARPRRAGRGAPIKARFSLNPAQVSFRPGPAAPPPAPGGPGGGAGHRAALAARPVAKGGAPARSSHGGRSAPPR